MNIDKAHLTTYLKVDSFETLKPVLNGYINIWTGQYKGFKRKIFFQTGEGHMLIDSKDARKIALALLDAIDAVDFQPERRSGQDRRVK